MPSNPPPWPAPGDQSDRGDWPEQIGPYRILGLLGEGGMGRVYRAWQSDPEREVALKVMRGLSSQAQARFRREAQLLAQLEHPGIARLYASGEADFGGVNLPWLAMEYVRGHDVISHADQAGLDLPERLQLLISIARAVDFAHGRGIIHRDLKPANVLVDAQGQVRVLDFGVARLHADDGELTQTGQVLGTLPYMSPEQLTGRGTLADVRADVYALGVIAFELIARRLPHPRLSTSSLLEALEIVRDQAVPRLSTLVAAARGDLDLVVMKALASEPEQRYASAAAFAADLQRVLDHRPVEARAPTLGYRLGRFVRRNRVLSAAAAAIVLVLIAASAISLRFAWSEAAARALAEQRAADAQAISDFLQDMLTSADPENSLGQTLSVRDVVDQAAVGLDGTQLPKPTAQRLKHVLSRVYLNLGELDAAQSLIDGLLVQLDPGDTAQRDLRQWVDGDRAEIDLARGDYAAAQSRLEALRAGDIDNPEIRVQSGVSLGHALVGAGRNAEAETVLNEVIATAVAELGPQHKLTLTAQHNLASLLQQQGHYAQAIELSQQVLAVREQIYGPTHPETLYSLNHLAAVFQLQGETAKAEPLMRRVLDARRQVLGSRHQATLTSKRNLAVLLIQSGRPEEAEALLREVVTDWQASRGDEAAQTLSARQLLAYVLTDRGANAEAEQILRDIVTVQQAQGGPQEPTLLSPRNDLAMALLARGEAAAALVEFDGLMGWAEAMLDADDVTLALFRGNRGDCLRALKRYGEARLELRRSLDVLDSTLGSTHPRSLRVAGWLADTLTALGDHAGAEALRASAPAP